MSGKGSGANRGLVVLSQAGRPYATSTQLTPQLGDRIARYVKMGDRPFVAALLCDVPKRTFFRWMEQGEQDDLDELATIYADFRHKIEAAQGSAEHSAVMAIRRATIDRGLPAGEPGTMRIPGDWKAALAWLSRSRDGWQERKEITGKDGAALYPSGMPELSDEEIEERLSDLRKRQGPKRSSRRASTAARTRTPRVKA